VPSRRDDVGIARGRLGLSVGEVVELENPVPLRLEVGSFDSFQVFSA